MTIVIPSKGRAGVIREKALALFPDAVVCVGADEVEAYSAVSKNLLVHPPEVVGIGPLRQWILDNVQGTVAMVDDDVRYIISQVGFKARRFDDPATACAIVERLAIMAEDAGCRVFGFYQGGGPLNYSNTRPFSFNHWVGGVVGVVGREIRFDTSLILRADIDFCLQSLLRDRMIMLDCRYCFIHTRFGGAGGNNTNRSSERHAREIAYLERKWGKYLEHVMAKGTTRLVVKVKR